MKKTRATGFLWLLILLAFLLGCILIQQGIRQNREMYSELSSNTGDLLLLSTQYTIYSRDDEIAALDDLEARVEKLENYA